MNAINSSWSWLRASVLLRKAADWLAWPLIVPVKVYQIVISPLFPRSCRFTPTCSSYAVEALKKHGILKGLGLMISRIVRCRPGNPGGYDPVP